MPGRNRKRRGVAMMELALVTGGILMPCLLGVIYIGSEFNRQLQVIQVTRDVGHMWSRKVDFTDAKIIALVPKLAQGLNFQTGSGDGLIVLSKIEYLSTNECPTGCINLNRWVLLQRLNLGNPSLPDAVSHYLPSPPSQYLNADGTVTTPDEKNQPGLALSGFNSITMTAAGVNPATNSIIWAGYPSGTPIYLVESYFKAAPTPGYYWSGVNTRIEALF